MDARFRAGLIYREVQARAASGQLLDENGEPIPAFEPPLNTIKSWCRIRRDEIYGMSKSPLEEMPHRDAIENLRVRLVNACHYVLQDFERTAQHQPKRADMKRATEIGRAIREAAALPGPKDPRPAAPGRGPQRPGDTTRAEAGTLAGEILREVHGDRRGKLMVPNTREDAE